VTTDEPPAGEALEADMDALLTAIVIWLSANYGLTMDFNHPRIERVPSIEMATLRYRSLLSARRRAVAVIQDQLASDKNTRDIIGIYNDQTNTIYLLDEWTGRTPAELSVLVHEMVHHLQSKARTRYECPAEREKLAYEAQDKWLGLFGRTLENDFHLDGLTLLVRTSCAMATGLH
jgi:Domain of unknown function (DUF6647)